MSNYFSRLTDNSFFESVEHWALLGLNWMRILRDMQMERKGEYYYSTCIILNTWPRFRRIFRNC